MGRQKFVRVGVEAEFIAVMRIAVEDVVALFVQGFEDPGADQQQVLWLGYGDGEALELAGEVAEFGGVEGLRELVAEIAALFAVGHDDWLGVVIDELEIRRAAFEFEAEEFFLHGLLAGEVGGALVEIRPAGEDVFLVEQVAVFPIVSAEVAFDAVEGEGIGRIAGKDFLGGIRRAADESGRCELVRLEDEDLPRRGSLLGGEFSFAVAAAGGLGDGVESSEGAEDDGEIDINAGFDELGGDEANRAICLEAGFDFLEARGAVLRAHEGGEVEA